MCSLYSQFRGSSGRAVIIVYSVIEIVSADVGLYLTKTEHVRSGVWIWTTK